MKAQVWVLAESQGSVCLNCSVCASSSDGPAFCDDAVSTSRLPHRKMTSGPPKAKLNCLLVNGLGPTYPSLLSSEPSDAGPGVGMLLVVKQ